jgi:AcrR family transcriptional regulator
MRARILAAAEKLITERGYEEAKIADICEEADVAYGTFFSHFPTKEDLLLAMVGSMVRDLGAHLQEIAQSPGSFEEHLRVWFDTTAEVLEASTDTIRDLLLRMVSLAHAAAAGDRQYRSAIEAFVEAEVAAGNVRGDVSAVAIADVLAGTAFQMTLSFIHFDDYDARKRAAATARILADGLEPSKTATRPSRAAR